MSQLLKNTSLIALIGISLLSILWFLSGYITLFQSMVIILLAYIGVGVNDSRSTIIIHNSKAEGEDDREYNRN